MPKVHAKKRQTLMVLFVGTMGKPWYTLGLLHSEGCCASFFAMLSGRELQLLSKKIVCESQCERFRRICNLSHHYLNETTAT